jgi:hypothetical protein
MWHERTSPRDAAVAIIAGLVLLLWAVTDTVLAMRGAFIQPDAPSTPPIGINLLLVFAGMALALVGSRTLRRLLAPLRASLYEDRAGAVHFTYDQPSTLLAQFEDDEIRTVAAMLDEKMRMLGDRIIDDPPR